jgi:hypothetical protein
MTNGPPGRDGPFEDRNSSKVEQLVLSRSSARTANTSSDDELALSLLWSKFIAAQKRAHKTLNIADGVAAGRSFRLFLEAAGCLDGRGLS